MTPLLSEALAFGRHRHGQARRDLDNLDSHRPTHSPHTPILQLYPVTSHLAHSPRSSWLVLEGRWRGSERITRFGPPRPEFELLCSRMVVLTTISSRSNPSLIILTITHHGGAYSIMGAPWQLHGVAIVPLINYWPHRAQPTGQL